MLADVSSALIAYAIGSVVWGVVVGLLFLGKDLREVDNPGASGTVRQFGVAAGALVVSIPVMILFYVLQRHLVAGLTAGSVKG